ncbi:hypothetical protein M0638_07655 [Roseomonas sp. NAR14]|uniref:Uncharacterized protein n=1 Tax=Roseomonas acroporae TaxID=2937791 RepID=A0A9X1Y667_9PROT|nr:hypothetical protein [Roseomonas acroporae]MCK8784251.1 hypothetical protein [Roseomonas acroporae]
MNWLDFLAVSEWPAVAAAGLAMFRRQIGALVARLGNKNQIAIPQLPKVSPLIEAAEELAAERLVSQGSSSPLAEGTPDPLHAAIDAEIELLTASDEYPSDYCLLRSWGSVERLARLQATALAKAQGKQHLSMAELTQALKLDGDDKALGRQLRDIRNRVADGEISVSPTDALRYRDLVVVLLRIIRERSAGQLN